MQRLPLHLLQEDAHGLLHVVDGRRMRMQRLLERPVAPETRQVVLKILSDLRSHPPPPLPHLQAPSLHRSLHKGPSTRRRLQSLLDTSVRPLGCLQRHPSGQLLARRLLRVLRSPDSSLTPHGRVSRLGWLSRALQRQRMPLQHLVEMRIKTEPLRGLQSRPKGVIFQRLDRPVFLGVVQMFRP